MKGLINAGNTCYFNSALQCLFHIPMFANHFISNDYSGDCVIIGELTRIGRSLWIDHADDKPADPTVLLNEFVKRHPDFDNAQQDLQEVILLLLDDVEKELPQLVKPFYHEGDTGKMVCSFVYPNGGSTNIKEASQVLIFTLPHRYACPLPPPKIELCNSKYSLISVGVHSGVQNGGHYITLGKHKGNWFLKDDEIVKPIEGFPNLHPKHCPYVMIYYRNSSG